MRKYPSRIFAAVAAAGLVASLSACQVKPGEYRIYKIAALNPTLGADCGFGVDPRDFSTFFGTGTIQLFATDADDYFLEWSDPSSGETAVMTGSRSGTEYTFAGDEVLVEDPLNNTTVTNTRTLDVLLEIKGYKLTGQYVLFTSSVCGGNCDGFANTQCTLTGQIVGTEIKDVELERGV